MVHFRLGMTSIKYAIPFACLVTASQGFIVQAPQKNHGAGQYSSPSFQSMDTSLSMGVRATLKRARDSVLNKDRTREELTVGIAGFYDRSSKLWEEVWGEHMHHGYYDPPERTDHQQAQIDLIDEVLSWSGVQEDNVNKPKAVVDVGCGIGGSSRHIAQKYGCTAKGVTLSPYQANRGNELAKEQGLEGQCSFQVRKEGMDPLAHFATFNASHYYLSLFS
jgi:hypothetical protein